LQQHYHNKSTGLVPVPFYSPNGSPHLFAAYASGVYDSRHLSKRTGKIWMAIEKHYL
jgi:hypothetical protein